MAFVIQSISPPVKCGVATQAQIAFGLQLIAFGQSFFTRLLKSLKCRTASKSTLLASYTEYRLNNYAGAVTEVVGGDNSASASRRFSIANLMIGTPIKVRDHSANDDDLLEPIE